MKAKIFILCAGLTLSACQTTQPTPPAPVACPPSLTQPLQDQPKRPAEADLILADSDEARAGGNAFLTYFEGLARWGRDGWARAENAKAFCERVNK
jgi:hypothetical protein